MNHFLLVRQLTLCAAVASSCLGSASAQTFEGRLADGTPSATCTVFGPNQCTMFFNPTLNITILNDWNLGRMRTTWEGAQAQAQSAGFAATGLTGWVLPTGRGFAAAGSLNQYLSIWTQVGSSFTGLAGQFAGLQAGDTYWSGSAGPGSNDAWNFNPINGNQSTATWSSVSYVVAVRPGDVAAIPEPQTCAMLLAGLGVVVAAVRRRQSATPVA